MSVLRTDSFAIATSAGGDVFVAASTPSRAHVLAWLARTASGRYEARGLAAGVGRVVAGQMRVDGSGVSVLVEDPRGGSYPVGYEQRDFGGSARWADRCF